MLISSSPDIITSTHTTTGKFESARLAVRNAQSHGLDPESVLLQECRIYRLVVV